MGRLLVGLVVTLYLVIKCAQWLQDLSLRFIQ